MKKITLPSLLQEMSDKLKLTQLIPEPFLLSETVIPTYDIAAHLLKWQIKLAAVSTAGATGVLYIHTVPATERWHIRDMEIQQATGVWSFDGLRLNRKTGGVARYYDWAGSQTGSVVYNPVQDLVLEPEDELGIYVDAWTSDGIARIYANCLIEKIR